MQRRHKMTENSTVPATERDLRYVKNEPRNETQSHDSHLTQNDTVSLQSFSTVSNRTLSMANSQTLDRPWFLYAVPLLVFILIAFHVFALVYWIYRLSTDSKQQQQLLQQQQQLQQQELRRKAH
ncbi:uncharacterized protein LOC123916184 [Trifolium pratense]|uniref:Uncharacterized protein n=1 Tax=Trifolium pratense TaxID=57577 RepID=A0ACB0M3C7_TRIPR|nr:uncharacterized protein LOC123916184 [Trifolium pratense]CAJ2675121.1 unnamed protein product [Trifolium pratense]